MASNFRPSPFSSFSSDKGFTVTNNTKHNVYLQTSDTDFVTIEAGETSSPQKASQEYPLLNNNKTNAKVYLTVKVDDGDGTFTVVPGTERGKFAVTSNFGS
ncbi:hypothetical protein M378DRAFT_167922 [Amanita muscaria Koide BX008]|uniref:Uncharacterized protein n=1 Tax=Amanita muscaria (strain Koide BX008) TaxID=946122 RepID=A0A0C2T276_AMAMK|nr:hypothetical protein M378DRAFT_167922 [Amanita muscaria Koide BX008]